MRVNIIGQVNRSDDVNENYCEGHKGVCSVYHLLVSVSLSPMLDKVHLNINLVPYLPANFQK